jgi:hypothetical protein
VNFLTKIFDRQTANLVRIAAGLLLLCFFSGSFQAFSRKIDKPSNLVYCPLMRDWVKKSLHAAEVKEPLDKICASEKRKLSFFAEAGRKYPLIARFAGDEEALEKLFFRFVGKSNGAFTEISPPGNAPSPQSAISSASEKSTGSYQAPFAGKQTESFTVARKARPPTASPTRRFFTAKTVRALENISRRIKPRAPPLFA